MSAFVVSKRDIDAIVTVLLERGLLDGIDGVDTPTTVGRWLWLENVNSVAHRYGMPSSHGKEYRQYRKDVKTYTYEPLPLTPGAARKIVACYDYQSCEHLGYETSVSKALVDKLMAVLPEDADYAAAPWGL